MRLIPIILSIFLLSTSMVVQADTWTGRQNVYDVYLPATLEGTFVRLTPFSVMINPDGCPNAAWYVLPKEHPLYKESHQMILTAAASGRKISFRLEGCSKSSTSRPLIEAVLIAG